MATTWTPRVPGETNQSILTDDMGDPICDDNWNVIKVKVPPFQWDTEWIPVV